MSKSDPIKENYDAAEDFDTYANWVYNLAALLSVVILLINRNEHPQAYDVVSIFFVLLVAALFVMGIVQRLYLMPKAENSRLKDFFSKAYDVSLAAASTDGYYNSPFVEPIRRIASQTLENSLFTSAIVRKMVFAERCKIAIYVAVWLTFVLTRQADIGLIAVATQAVFSEQILSRWFRVEWLRSRSSYVFDELFRSFQMDTGLAPFAATAMYLTSVYETAKANAGIILPTRLFEKLNPKLSQQWAEISAKICKP